jgi:hypothetical protein
MFCLLHTYMPETWDAQVRSGLIDKYAGIRFPQSALLEQHNKFNEAAKEGGRLYNIVEEMKCPVYIDRLQGGAFYEDYEYDERLIESYRELLGERFLGFQMHEWMSNYRGDIKKVLKGGISAWTSDEIEKSIRRQFPYPLTFLEAMNAREMAGFGLPQTWEEFLRNSEELYRRRQKTTLGTLIPCDSYYLAPQPEISLGSKLLMPEIGRQTPDTRIQIAYSRGMARAHKISFGAYYEPWGGQPFSACCYQKDGLNEWNIGKSTDFPFETMGENGGSSRSMQRRMYIYAYFAGAQFISEEWGMCNTFYDWKDFELSPYGEVKADFLRLVDKYPDPGEIYTPVAVLLPEDLQVLEGMHRTEDEYLGYPCHGGFAETLRTVRKAVCKVFSDAVPMCGNETTSLINSEMPDAIDLLHAGGDLSRYEYVVNLSGKKQKSKREISPDEVITVLRGLLPCSVSGGVHWFVTRRRNGWYLIILNNDGIERTVESGDKALPEGARTVKVSVKQGSLKHLEGSGIRAAENCTYVIEIPSGGWFLGEI